MCIPNHIGTESGTNFLCIQTCMFLGVFHLRLGTLLCAIIWSRRVWTNVDNGTVTGKPVFFIVSCSCILLLQLPPICGQNSQTETASVLSRWSDGCDTDMLDDCNLLWIKLWKIPTFCSILSLTSCSDSCVQLLICCVFAARWSPLGPKCVLPHWTSMLCDSCLRILSLVSGHGTNLYCRTGTPTVDNLQSLVLHAGAKGKEPLC